MFLWHSTKTNAFPSYTTIYIYIYMNEERALRKPFTGEKVTELGNLYTVACKIKNTWGKPAEENITEDERRIRTGWGGGER